MDESPDPPKKRRRSLERKRYADLYARLIGRVEFARALLAEAADADPATCKALLNVAMKTLAED